MRIAMLAHSNSAWTPHYLRFFCGQGHTVRVISFTADALPHSDVVFIRGTPPWPVPKLLWFATRLPQVRTALRRFRPDVVFATYLTSNGLAAALTWSGPLVVSARGGDVLRQAGYLAAPVPIHRAMMRFVCRRATRCHAVSEELVDALSGYGVARSRFRCFPVGVSLAEFRRSENRPPSETLRIVCTRRQEDVYQNSVVISALELLREREVDFRCTLVGGGPSLEEFRERIRGAGMQEVVKFVGEVPHDSLTSYLQAADVYVSAASSDGTSSSLLEAMSCGLFPVVSDIRANRPWVEHEQNGLLFPVGDAAGLAEALKAASNRRESFARVARYNRGLVERLGNQESNNRRLMSLLEDAIEDWKSSH